MRGSARQVVLGQPGILGQYFAACEVKPTAARMALVSTLISALEAAGVWSKLDMLYVMAAHDAQAARINLRAPRRWPLTVVGSPVFTANEGYAGDAVSARLDMGVAWSGLQHLQLDSAHVGYWINGGTDASSTAPAVGSVTGSTSFRSRPRDSGQSGNFSALLNGAVSIFGTGHGTVLGHFIVTRRGTTELEGYFNGASLGTDNETSTAVPGALMCTHFQNAIYSDFELSFVHVGAALSDTEAEALYNALNTYKASL